YELDHTLRQASALLAATTPEIVEETEEPEVAVNPALLAALKKWRLEQARTASVPAYVIAHDSVLELIALKQPTTAQALLGIKGFGNAKADKYGDDILKLVTQYSIGAKSSSSREETVPIDVVKPLNEDLAAYRAETIAQYPRAFKRDRKSVV